MSSRYPSRDGDSSQYKEDVYMAHFRDGDPSWIHARVLESWPHLGKRVYKNPDEDWPLCVDFKEFDHHIGHAIIHYLYTGNHRNVEHRGLDYQRELAESIRVYVAAASISLSILNYHAEKEILRLCDLLSLQNIFDVLDDLRIELDQFEALKKYLQNRMAKGSFGAPGVTTQDALRDLQSANTISTLALKTVVLQHQRRMNEKEKRKNATVADDHASMHNQPQALDTGAKSALQFMECELESLLVKRAGTGRKLAKSDKERMRSLKAEIKRLKDLRHVKDISDIERSTDNSAKTNTRTSSIEVARQSRNERAKSFVQKPADTSKNKLNRLAAGLKPDHTGAVWLGRKGNSNHFYVDDLESFEDDMSITSDSVPWMTPSSTGCSWDE
ncbi:hypothetical protein ACHAPO_006437 [Fusarium lateritium]